MIHRKTVQAQSSAERVVAVFQNTMIHCGGKLWRETLVTAEMRATLTQVACGFQGKALEVGKWTFPDGSRLDGGWLFPDRVLKAAPNRTPRTDPPQALVA